MFGPNLAPQSVAARQVKLVKEGPPRIISSANYCRELATQNRTRGQDIHVEDYVAGQAVSQLLIRNLLPGARHHLHIGARYRNRAGRRCSMSSRTPASSGR